MSWVTIYSALDILGLLLCSVYCTIPLFWLVFHPFVERWRKYGRRAYLAIVPAWGVFIAAAGGRKEALDHVLFVGPPGLGKTTLAQIVARELAVNFRATSGPVIAKAGDLAALLSTLE